jgi:hypothetical protein
VRLIRTSFLAAIAVGSGVIVLMGYFVDVPILTELRSILLQWAVILVSISLIAGQINLVMVHLNKIKTRQTGMFFSLVLILSLLFTLVFVGYFGPTSPQSIWIFDNIQIPAASSLVAVLSIILTYGAIRLFRRGFNLFSLIFVVTVLIIIFGSINISNYSIPGFSEMRRWILNVPAVGGARGLLFGIALGSITTGLRILIASDRPYSR